LRHSCFSLHRPARNHRRPPRRHRRRRRPNPPAAAPHPLSFRGFFRAYDFTRQNASKGIGGAGQVNQQSIELGLGLHGDYRFGHTPFPVGASHLVAISTDGCARRGLLACGVVEKDIDVVRVPGCFELPVAPRRLISGLASAPAGS